MKIVSTLFRLARLSADIAAIAKAMKTGSPMPLVRRGTNKLVGRNLFSRLTWKGPRK